MNKQRRWGATPWTGEDIPHSPGRDHAAEVAIIGAGLTGASSSYHLARRGIAATIFEAGRVGDGASGRTGGLVLEGTAAGPLEEVSSCISELDKLVAVEAIDCGLHLSGCWEIAHGKSPEKVALPWDDSGQPVHIAATVSGGVVEPARLLTGILKAAVARGAAVQEHAPVARIVTQPRPGVEFAGHTVYPKYIVAAVNAWLPALLANSVSVRSSLTFACATAPLDRAALDAIGLGEGIPFYTADLPYLWGRTVDDGRAIFGSGLVFGSPEQLAENDISAGSSHTLLMQLQDRVSRLHPKLREVGFSASWGGPIAFTPDAVPLLGRLPSCPNIIVAGAYSGHGVALSVRAGQLIARAIAEGAELPPWGALDRKPSRAPRWQR
jgi:gamma-glutamylputrescine oxidase